MGRIFTKINVATDTFFEWLLLSNKMANAYANVVTTAMDSNGDTNEGNAFVTGIFGANTLTANYQLRGGTVNAAANLAVVSNVTFSGANTYLTSNVFISAANTTVYSNTFSVLGTGSNAVTISTNSTATNTRIVANSITITGVLTVTNSSSFSNSVSVTGPLALSNTLSFDERIVDSNTATVSTATATVIDSFSANEFRAGKYVISVKDTGNSTYQTTELLVMHSDIDVFITEYATLRSVANNIVTFSANLSGTTVRLWVTPSVGTSTYKIARDLLVI